MGETAYLDDSATVSPEQFDYVLLATLPARLRRVLSEDDHQRGCQGREYACTCGYDDKILTITDEAAEAIERLQRDLVQVRADRDSHQREAIRLLSPSPTHSNGEER